MLGNAKEAGFYEAKVSVQAPGMPVAVNIDPIESNVTSLTNTDLNTNLEGLDITLTHSEAELAAAIESSRTGRSSWRQFMIAAIIILILESLLADRLRSRKQKRSSQAADNPETHPAT